MSDSEPTRLPGVELAVMAALAVAVAFVARAWTGPLGPDATPLYAVPPLFAGLYLVIGATWMRDVGLYGAAASALPPVGHAAVRVGGFALIGAAGWVLLALPPAGAGAVGRGIAELDGYCRGPTEVRVERPLLPLVDDLLALRGSQSRALRAELDGALRVCMTRCGDRARAAFRDPEGTHASWRRLRDWLVAHPALHDLPPDDPLWSLAWRERARPPEPSVPVPVVLEP